MLMTVGLNVFEDGRKLKVVSMPAAVQRTRYGDSDWRNLKQCQHELVYELRTILIIIPFLTWR